ncbi:serine hydrolase domain-containing protein [Sphingomonas sp. BK235]|uniref:serine hydrolase domain-containing protein n=1 Tax=Sphingomonas sp. BK235 TaxID=2512131 RepID=UPI0010497F75|nr:serine hydrolase domain-containing protein [Sphingomonas sp. BK235]TCP36697.1 CubicO group peptidase (beta-lactamase class C family) [Sphingomonas sp. BK235]
MRIRPWMTAIVAALAAGTGAAQGPAPVPAPRAVATAAPAPAPIAAATQGARALTAEDLAAWLDGFMPYALHQGDIAGAVVTVVQNGQIIANKGYGYADVASRRPVDPARTLFRPGSVSKLVTWTAVMQQVEAGKIDLDRDVNAYLDFRIPPRDGKPVTMRQLMTHTAGFEEAVKDLIAHDPKALLPLDAYLKRWVPRRIFAPGTTPGYSNWGTSLAGYIVARVAGRSFDDYVEQRVFGALGMRTASFRQPLPPALRPLMASGYPRASEKPGAFEIVVPAPAGALSASGLDMAKFMIAHLQGGRGLMRADTARMMHQSPLDRVDPMSLIPPLNRMELGFFETNVNGREVIAHLGDTENFHTSLHLFLDEGVGLYVSFNSAGRDGAAHTIRGQLFQDFADRYYPATARDGRVDAGTAAAHARAMVGLWQNSRHSQSNFIDVLNLFGETKVAVNGDGRLVIDALKGPGGATQVWDEIAPYVWRDRGGHDRLAAKVIDGKVVRWSHDGFSPFMVFDRVPASRSAAWLLPALYASLAVLALSALFWPAAWFVRRRYKVAATAAGAGLRAYRASRVMAWAEIALLGAWTTFILMAFSNLDMLGRSNDWLVWLLQLLGAIVFYGAVVIMAWNAWQTWRDGRGWARRGWSVLMLLASLVVVYVAETFGLLAMTASY